MSLCLVFYISGHGFGHAARSIEVINAILASNPATKIVVRTSAARWLFDLTVRGSVQFHEYECDTGVYQLDSLHLDEQKTLDRARRFYRTFDARADAEAGFLQRAGATVVAADMPPLAFAAAARADVPSVALGNFTWDWIYQDYVEREPAGASREFLRTIGAAYGKATLVLRLPMWGGFDAFSAPIVDIPFVARHARHDPAETRRVAGIPDGRPLVFISFGGHDIKALDLAALARLDRYTIVMTGPTRRADVPEGLVWVDEVHLHQQGFRYEDLVRACDVVVTKPGYGIIAECLANTTAMLYTSRGRFREYPVLIKAMPKFLRCRFIGQLALQRGEWEEALETLLAQPAPAQRPPTNGAEVAAARIVALSSGQWSVASGQ
ncbi:MAG: hypothetical protein HY654_09145 [Acidobacteria bacterium]|nr:hypothetical protein [Acidobacteriota bacterium]